jgi:RNA polymerase sigma-70 factor (ECF subfamily)
LSIVRDTTRAATESSVVALARAGEAAAWRDLYDRHAGRLLLWLRQLPSGDPSADHEDLAMEAWAVAASRIADFTGGDDDFGGWLFTIARNHLLNARRKVARRATYSTADLPEVPVPAETAAVDHHDAVRRALAALPTREGEVIACMDVVGLDLATTAQVLGVKRPAARMARTRGLARLRRHGWEV